MTLPICSCRQALAWAIGGRGKAQTRGGHLLIQPVAATRHGRGRSDPGQAHSRFRAGKELRQRVRLY